MFRRTHRRSGSKMARSFYIVICLVVFMPFVSLGQSADEEALGQLADRFYSAYVNSDPNTLLLLVSRKSPRFADIRSSIELILAVARLEVKRITIEGITVEGDKANVRVIVDLTATDIKTGGPLPGPGRPLKRTLHCVREGDTWKVWESRGAEKDLMDALLNAKTDEERKAAIAAVRDMPAPFLTQLVIGMASLLYTKRDYSRALSLFELGKDLATQAGDKKWQAYALGGIGSVNDAQGNYKTGLEYYQKSLLIEEELGNNSQIGWLLNCIGRVQQLQGDYPNAIEHYQRALKVLQGMGDTSGVARVLYEIGYLHLAQGRRAEAMEDSQKSLKLSEAGGGDKSLSANALTNIGFIYQHAGNRTLALEYFQRALKIQEELGEKASVATSLISIGDVHRTQGNEAQALEYYQTALKIATEIGNKELVSNAIGALGNVQYAFGNYSRALEYQQESLKILEEVGTSHSTWICLYNIGVLHQLLGNTALALNYHQRSLRICEKKGDKEGIATTLFGIGSVYLDRGDYSQAVDLGNRGIAASRSGGPVSRLVDLYSLAGKGYRGLNKPEQARQAFAEAIAVVEELRSNIAGGTKQQQRFFAKESSPYYDMVDLLVSQQDVVDAFAFAERVKGRALLDTLQSGRDNITGAMTTSDQEEERKLNGEVNSLNIQITREKVLEQPDQARLADLDARLQKARLDQERFQINLYAAHPELRVHRGQMQPISLDQAGKLIPDKDTALLEYVVGKDKTQLFVLTKRPEARGEQSAATPILKVYTLNINEKDLAGRVRKFRGRLANQDFLFHEPARELYDLLLGPAREELLNKTNLIIVPDGILWELPFQALQPAPKRFLIENSAISYAPSLTVLLEMTREHSTVAINSPKLLALGNPAIGKQTTQRINSVLMDERLDPLPEAERQVKELSKLYGPGRSKIYIGPEAQEAVVKREAAGYGILHLAAHGILNDKNPMYSQVVLSQPEGDINEDGMLEAWEIMKLDLKADLVVLSACETARGKVGNGEGMIGLTWAFFVAGVPTTVASQWSVEAASTTELMVEFHRNLERHKSKAESLRQAMLKLLKTKEYNRPFYWAGFVVVGNGR